jgi:hypothetical protein
VLNLAVYVLNRYVRNRLLQEIGSVEVINNVDLFQSTLVTLQPRLGLTPRNFYL